jgi:hypothetical protein
MPLLLPGGLVFQIGKSGIGYLLSASNLGHTGGTPAYSQSVCGGSWGGGIYYNGVIYVTCSNGLHALALNASAPSFSPLSGWTVNSSAVGPPIEAGGLIWSAGYNNGILYGLNPSTGATSFSSNLGGFKHFMTPSAGGGLLFVANVSAVTAFKIANGPPPSPTGETLSSSANPAAVGQTVTLTATVSPTPDAGTVAFTDGGAAIPGCGAVAVNPITPQATCMTSFGTTGQHPIVATYSGDAYYTGSSASLTQGVASSSGGSPGPGPTGKIVPVISKLRARALAPQAPAHDRAVAKPGRTHRPSALPRRSQARTPLHGPAAEGHVHDQRQAGGEHAHATDARPRARALHGDRDGGQRLRRSVAAVHRHVRRAAPVSATSHA